jgi:hypothetical protein
MLFAALFFVKRFNQDRVVKIFDGDVDIPPIGFFRGSLLVLIGLTFAAFALASFYTILRFYLHTRQHAEFSPPSGGGQDRQSLLPGRGHDAQPSHT